MMNQDKQVGILSEALRLIARWKGEFPETCKSWPDGSPMSYGAAYGSNGERDYMRQVALDALAAAEPIRSPLTPKDEEGHSAEKEWLIDGSLLYTLRDGSNYDEINVTMADGSRDTASRSEAAKRMLAGLSIHSAYKGVDVEVERAAFEKWVKTDYRWAAHTSVSRGGAAGDGEYGRGLQECWEAWLGRAGLASSHPIQEQAEPLFYISEQQIPLIGRSYYFAHRKHPEGLFQFPVYAVSHPIQPAPAEPDSEAIHDVLAERQRQKDVEGWTPEHDDEHGGGEMADAAACYAANAGGVVWANQIPSFWPWASGWWKPSTPRRDLVKAGALILAEIERLDRAALALKEPK